MGEKVGNDFGDLGQGVKMIGRLTVCVERMFLLGLVDVVGVGFVIRVVVSKRLFFLEIISVFI